MNDSIKLSDDEFKRIAIQKDYEPVVHGRQCLNIKRIKQMKNEIIDAIREHYKNDESTVVDCLSWLSTGNLLELVEVARDELISMNYCPYCGNKLQVFTYREYHPEVDEPMQFEERAEMCCPNCDFN